MENIDIILQAIATVGFPIIIALILLYFLLEEKKDHKEEMTELRDVIAQNNEVLASLKQLIEDKINALKIYLENQKINKNIKNETIQTLTNSSFENKNEN